MKALFRRFKKMLVLITVILLSAGLGGYVIGNIVNNAAAPPGAAAREFPEGQAVPSGETVRVTGIKVVNACSTCHRFVVPENHKQANWSSQHGINLTAGAEVCNKCHGYDTARERRGDFRQFNLAQLKLDKGELQGKVNCGQCHLPGHPANWLKDHPTVVKGEGLAQCQTCHSFEGCNACHRARLKVLHLKIDFDKQGCLDCHTEHKGFTEKITRALEHNRFAATKDNPLRLLSSDPEVEASANECREHTGPGESRLRDLPCQQATAQAC